MLKLCSILFGLVLALPFTGAARAAGTCEQQVVQLCVATTCPAFCSKAAAADKASCAAACMPEKRCKLALFGGQDQRDQVELDVQKRAQLMACLAENRAPIVVAEKLGAPKLESTPAVGSSSSKKRPKKPTKQPSKLKPAKPATLGKVKDVSAQKATWKATQTASFTRRQAGQRRINPVVTPPVTKAAPPPKKK